jgi:hypothetical protein
VKATHRACFGLAALLVLTLNVGCIIPLVRQSQEESAGMTWSIRQGNERCHLLKLPETWSDLDDGVPPYIDTPYQLRRDGQSATLVFMGLARQVPMGRLVRSLKNYGLDLASSTIAWPVSEAQWARATDLPLSAERCFPKGWGNAAEDIQLRGRQTCRCDNKDFPKSGKWDGFPVFSSSHKWLAVNTWNGSYTGGSNRQIGQPIEAFVDVYRVDTGEKTIVLTAHVGAEIDIKFFGGIRWLGDDFLIIPVHQFLEEFLICDLRESPRRPSSSK